MPLRVKRNAYGRQLGSFETRDDIKGLGDFPMVFIRAPYIEKTAPGVEVIANVDGKAVAASYKNQIGLAFHPELSGDTRRHEAFIEKVKSFLS